MDGMMYYADATDATLQVSIELADLRSALLNLPGRPFGPERRAVCRPRRASSCCSP